MSIIHEVCTRYPSKGFRTDLADDISKTRLTLLLKSAAEQESTATTIYATISRWLRGYDTNSLAAKTYRKVGSYKR